MYLGTYSCMQVIAINLKRGHELKERKRGSWDLGRQESHPFPGCPTDRMGWQLVGEIAITIVDDLQSTKVNVALSFYECIL